MRIMEALPDLNAIVDQSRRATLRPQAVLERARRPMEDSRKAIIDSQKAIERTQQVISRDGAKADDDL